MIRRTWSMWSLPLTSRETGSILGLAFASFPKGFFDHFASRLVVIFFLQLILVLPPVWGSSTLTREGSSVLTRPVRLDYSAFNLLVRL